MYGLREAPRIWYELLTKELKSIGLVALPSAPCVFRGKGVVVICYVDDLLVLAEDIEVLKAMKIRLSGKLPGNDLGKAVDFLGMKIIHGKDSLLLGQNKYSKAILADMNMLNCREVTVPSDPSVELSTADSEAADEDFPYRKLIGSLMYIGTRTRPDISVVVSMLARHVESPGKKLQAAAIRVLKYLKSTPNHGHVLKPGSGTQLSVHVDSNWAGEPGTQRRSRTGIVIRYGDAVVSFSSTLQKCIALSSSEAEYVAMSEAVKNVVWLRRVLAELDIPQDPTEVYEDNSGALKWATGHVAEDFRRSKHIELRYHYVRDQVRKRHSCHSQDIHFKYAG